MSKEAPKDPMTMRTGFLLLLLICSVVAVWMLPVLVSGKPLDAPRLLFARNVAASGSFLFTDEIGRFLGEQSLHTDVVPSAHDGRLSALIIAFLSQFLQWDQYIAWTVLGALSFAAGLGCYFFTVRQLLSERIAWVSTTLLGLMPLMVRDAIALDEFNVALPLFFASMTAFVMLQKKHLTIALLLSGILYGAACSAKDVFLIFAPWYVLSCIWLLWRDTGKLLRYLGVFSIAAAIVYLLPYIGDIRELGYPINQNIARVWPGDQQIQNAIYLHFYPDSYTYFFDREAYDASYLAELSQQSPLAKLHAQKAMINFDVGSPHRALVLLNSAWLLLANIPNLFHLETVGGIVLWFFIVPGVLLLWQRKRTLTILLLGLMLSSELIIRFALNYSRSHVADYLWIIALFAGIGLCAFADLCAKQKKMPDAKKLTIVLTLVLSLFLLQVNRSVLARDFQRARPGIGLHIAMQINQAPQGSVIALHKGSFDHKDVVQHSAHTLTLFASDTVEKLLETEKIPDAFAVYGITHIYGFDDDLTHRIHAQADVEIVPTVPYADTSSVQSTFLKTVLHFVR